MTNGTEREHLASLLFEGDTTLINLRCFRIEGGVPVTKDEIAAEFRSAIEQKRNGTATVSKRFNDDAKKIDVRALVAGLQK